MSEHLDIERLARWIAEAQRIAVLTGAGISTESGIPDFRSATGLYADPQNANVFDLAAFRVAPEHFYRFARTFYPMVANAQPNPAHRVLARWEHEVGKPIQIATQNVDDLHQRAGSSRVFPVHGDYRISYCLSCGAESKTEAWVPCVMSGKVPRCHCGGLIKPKITFFGEMLPEDAWEASVEAMSEADLVLILGTSLQVYPAASLPDFAPPSAHRVIVNRDPTARDDLADLVIYGSLSEVLTRVDGELRRL